MSYERIDKYTKLFSNLYSSTESVNFRNLYQEVADYIIPREDQIIAKTTPGEDKSQNIFDPTGQLDLNDMVSGLSAAFFPPGELAFGLRASDRKTNELDHIKKYLSLATQITHDELYASNFMLQLNETLTSCVGFGTGNLYSEFLIEPGMPLGLNFRDWDVASYVFTLNSYRRPNGVIIKYKLTAQQAYNQYGKNAGGKIVEAVGDVVSQEKTFEFLHVVVLRDKYDPNLSDNKNWIYESVVINNTDKIIVEEGGFEEFPFAVARWTASSNEKWGRGQGTKALSTIKELQQMHLNLKDCANRHNYPALEVLDHFDGRVRVKPGSTNFVREKGTIRGIEQQALGNFPISKEILVMEQDIIHRAFYTDVFAPLANLTGDRRTTMEIIQRVKQAMKKLALPVYRLQTELFTPTIVRSVNLLIRNGRIPELPEELKNKGFKIEYIGELALAMRDQQTRAFQQFAGLVTELDGVFPGAKDSISMDRALPDIAISFGVKAEHLSTDEEKAEKAQNRAAQAQQQAQLQMAEVGSKGYKNTKETAEPGSPAEQMQEALVGAE